MMAPLRGSSPSKDPDRELRVCLVAEGGRKLRQRCCSDVRINYSRRNGRGGGDKLTQNDAESFRTFILLFALLGGRYQIPYPGAQSRT